MRARRDLSVLTLMISRAQVSAIVSPTAAATSVSRCSTVSGRCAAAWGWSAM